MRSLTYLTSGNTLDLTFRQLKPTTRLRLLLFILVLFALACLLGIYSVPDVIATGRPYLATVRLSLII